MKRTIKGLLAAAGLAFLGLGSLLTASPAQAAIVCDEQGQSGTQFPLDGIDGPLGPKVSHAFRCKNTATGVLPSDARTQDLYNSLASATMPVNVKNTLKSKSFKYFFFNNRAEAITYFNSTAPYNDAISWDIVTPFVNPVSRCGNTGFALNRFTGERLIATMIYDNCTYDQNTSPAATVPNPSVRRTGFHETGHAFDFALGGTARLDIPSNRSGFSTLSNGDKAVLTPADWGTRLPALKNSYVCNLFSSIAPTALEKDLGANSSGGPAGQVCKTDGTPYLFYQNKTPTQIAPDKMPYFWNTNQETWAELFVIVVENNNTSPAGFLPLVDRVMGMNQPPIRSFNCVRADLESYINLLTNPKPLDPSDPYSLQTKGCPVPTGEL